MFRSRTVINYGSGSEFLTSYGSGSISQKVTVPTVPVPQRCCQEPDPNPSYESVAEFIHPCPGGIKSTPALGCRTGPPGYGTKAGGPVRQSYAGVDFIFQSGIFEFGYRSGLGLV
jgi:hypothetical protein